MIQNTKKLTKIITLDFISKWGTLLVIVGMFLFFTFDMWGLFLTRDNMINILRSVSITTIISIGMTFAVSVNGMDLSIGAIAGFAMNIVAMMFLWYQMNTFFSIFIAIGLSTIFGLLNALLIVKFRIPDMLGTLATSFMIGGISITMAGGGSITEGIVRLDGQPALGKMTLLFRELGRAPWIIIIMLTVVTLAFIFFAFMKHGRYLYVVGQNIEAARLSGIPVNRYRTFAYIIASVCAAIGGVLLASRLGSAQLGAADGYLMPAVAATFIGLSVAGSGKANPLGTLAGAFLMGLMENGLIMESVPYYSMNIFKGIVLAIALTLAFFRKSSKS
ncbi:MAG: ABC transporter permease [Methanomassiliicoccales archaeon]|jgi:simple sugar transport system permease protein